MTNGKSRVMTKSRCTVGISESLSSFSLDIFALTLQSGLYFAFTDLAWLVGPPNSVTTLPYPVPSRLPYGHYSTTSMYEELPLPLFSFSS